MINFELLNKELLLLMHSMQNQAAPVTPAEEIINAVCEVLEVDYDHVMSKNRNKDNVEARFIIFHILKNNVKLTLKQIAELIGGKHHTTVLYGLESFDDLLLIRDKVFLKKLQKVQAELNIDFSPMKNWQDELKKLDELQDTIHQSLQEKLGDLAKSILYKQLTEVLKQKRTIYKQQFKDLKNEY